MCAAVAALVVLPGVWLVIRGAEAGGMRALAALVEHGGAQAVGRSLALSAGVAVACVALSAPAVWLTEATDLPGRRWWRVLLALPLAVPSYVSGFVVVAALGPTGWLSSLGGRFEVYGPAGATLALLYAWPYALIPMRAAFARVDVDAWDAARSLGATPWRAFRDVVVPVVRPAMAGGGLLVALYALGDFGAVATTRFRTLSYLIYLRFQSFGGRDQAVLYSWLLVALAAGLWLAHRWVSGKADSAVSASTRRVWRPIALGRFRGVALAYVGLLSLYGVGLPLGVVAYWLWRGVGNGAPIHPFDDAMVNTLWVSLAGAAIVVGAGMFPALARVDTAAGRVLRGSVNLGFALPGIVVALALVFFASQHAHWVYQSTPLLLIAYVVRFVPVASGAVGEHAARLHPRLVEASRSLGRRPSQVLWTVTLPLLAPALWAAFLAAFVSIAKELPATLLLAPLEFDTLATHIWAQTEEAFFTSVAPPVLVLVALSAAIGTWSQRLAAR